MNIKNSILDYIRSKELNWYGYVQRMEEERPSWKILECSPPVRRGRGKPRNSWMKEVTRGMRQRGVGSLVCRQGEAEKENKIVTLGTDRCENIKNLCINK